MTRTYRSEPRNIMQVTERSAFYEWPAKERSLCAEPSRVSLQEACHYAMLALLIFVCVGCNPRFVSTNTASQAAGEANFHPPVAANSQGQQLAVVVPPPATGAFRTAVLASQIDNYYRGANPGPIGVTTFANLDDLYSTSSFGRVVAEQLMSELAMRGYDVVELRHTDALQFLQPTGEFALSRDVATIRRERDLGALVVGTYMVSPVKVYVNARLLNPATSVVLSAGSIELPRTAEVAKLLRGSSLPPALERIPVRHLGTETYPLYGPSHLGRLWDLEESTAVAPRIPAPPTASSKRAQQPRQQPSVAESKPIVPPPSEEEAFK